MKYIRYEDDNLKSSLDRFIVYFFTQCKIPIDTFKIQFG